HEQRERTKDAQIDLAPLVVPHPVGDRRAQPPGEAIEEPRQPKVMCDAPWQDDRLKRIPQHRRQQHETKNRDDVCYPQRSRVGSVSAPSADLQSDRLRHPGLVCVAMACLHCCVPQLSTLGWTISMSRWLSW